MAVPGEITTILDLVPEPLRWIVGLGLGIGGGLHIFRRYSSERQEGPGGSEVVAKIESAAIVDPAVQKQANEILSDLRTEMRSIRFAVEAMEKRQADAAEERKQFEEYEIKARLKALEISGGAKR